MDREAFKKRMQSLKSYRELNPGKGYWEWRNSLPDNLPYTNDSEYDMRGAYESEALPKLQDDGSYRLPTRDPKTSKILKKSIHPTYWKGIAIDAGLGYKPYFFGNSTYTWNNEDGPFIPWLKAELFLTGGEKTGYTTYNTYGDITHRLPVSLEEDTLNIGLPDVVVTPFNFDPTRTSKTLTYVKYELPYFGNPYLHFIFTGPVGQKALDFVEFVDPSQYENLMKSRMHYGNIAEGLSRKSYQLGGEVESKYPLFINGQRVNRWTGLPIATGQATPVFDLRTAANFTPIGDVLTVRDAYTAARNRDWLGLGLAGLGIVPFIPTVNKGAISDAISKVLRRLEKANKTLEEFNRQRDDVYESLIENEEAFRRAANADRTSGSNYLGTYQLLIREHGSDNLRDKVRMEFDPNLYGTSTKALVNPHNPTYITINTRYKDPDELDNTFKQINPGLIRHEMGHITDVRAGLDYTDKLADPAKFVSDEKLKEMFPSNYEAFRKKILNRGSEIKSYMNEFRQFLYDHGDRDTKETVKSFRRKLDAYGKDFKNLRMIFDSYKNSKQFIKDYNSVPLTSTDRNENLV